MFVLMVVLLSFCKFAVLCTITSPYGKELNCYFPCSLSIERQQTDVPRCDLNFATWAMGEVTTEISPKGLLKDHGPGFIQSH